jgi:NAD(P)-dependent dehydrogenase (short-subunit alcohol dehydrogenase family)
MSVPPAALVTGGARRIGQAIVRALADAGYAVAVHTNRSVADAQALCANIQAEGGRAAVVQADLADHDAVLSLVPSAVQAIGPLTLLVNNAGEFEPDTLGALELARFERHLAVDLRAPVFLAQAFAAQLPAGAAGAIVNVTDQRVARPTPNFFSYTLAKSALTTATVTMAQALAPRVRVNAVAPGPTLPSERQSAEMFARQSTSVPLGRGPTPEEIAAAVLYLAGARSVTGQTLMVDGGQHIEWRRADGIEE